MAAEGVGGLREAFDLMEVRGGIYDIWEGVDGEDESFWKEVVDDDGGIYVHDVCEVK